MPSLQQGRLGPSVCTLDNKIFVLGGVYDDTTTCEMLDLSDDDPNWRNIAQMNSGHYGGGVVVIERKIYVLGGYDDTTTCEMLDLSDDDPHWRYIAQMNSRYCSAGYTAAGAVVIDKKIYVLGGRNFEVYDVDTGILMN